MPGGAGKTRDVSRTGIYFETETSIPPGTILHLIVDWPTGSDEKTRIDWIVDGVVVRSTSSGTALHIMRQRFERRPLDSERLLAG